MFIVLEPWSDRKGANLYDEDIARRIQQQCSQELNEAAINIFRAPAMRGLGNAGGFQLQVEQHGFVDLNALQTQTNQLVARANADPHFAGVFTQFRANTPQLFVDIDRAKVEQLQVPLGDVFATMQVSMGGRQVNQFNRFGRTWWVNIMAAPEFRTSPDYLRQLQVRTNQGAMVPFGTIANVEPTTGPVTVMRYNLYASAPVNGMAAPGVSSGQAMQAMDRLASELNVPFEWTQLTFLQQQAGNVGILAFGLATVMVYLILAAKYESWRLPLAVILVVPLCLLAALTGLLIVSLPVDIFVEIGLLVLIGLASKNAILIVEYGRDLRMEGKDIREAAEEASRIRFRPIIMTSLAFTLGVVPLIIATGAGKEMRQVLGTAVFSGMIGVTIFGVFLTPVLFFALLRLRGGEKVAAPPAAELE
jgi:multidrug efflux pump